MRINLEAKNNTEKIVLNYLEKNASDELAEKINNGKKTLAGCWKYITSEAKKYLKNNSGAVEDEVVFGWAVHYFEEDSIEEGKLPQTKAKVTTSNNAHDVDDQFDEVDEDDSEETTPTPKVEKKKVTKPKEEAPNKAYAQTSLFDLM
jgi:hypothetical protein